MIEDRQKLIPFLNGLALFRRLTPGQMESLLDNFDWIELKPDQRLFSQGDPGDSLYIVVSGKMRVSRGPEGRERELGTLTRGDVFGEEALISHRPRSASLTAVAATQLLRLDREKLENILQEYPYIKPYLIAMIHSRRLARESSFRWMSPGETIYLMARKHLAFLYIVLIPPVLLGWLSLPFFLGAVFLATTPLFELVLLSLGLGILFVALLWGIWRWIDWGNDYYIVTDQRVVWIEKVIWLYESREEAPLTTVLTVKTEQDLLGRWLGYGDVVVSTFTGKIVMQKVGMPEQLADYIRELQGRASAGVEQAETEVLEREIRVRLGFEPAEEPKKGAGTKTEAAPVKSPKKTGAIRPVFDNLFKMRYENKGMVIYRKHWILLLRAVWLPGLLIIAILSLWLVRIAWGVLDFIPFALLLMFTILGGLILLGWLLYGYADWVNDLYQLTPDQIVDVYKKPLGKVDRKTASLENILSLQHTTKGLLGLILNYGDVVAMVGGTPFTFDGVYNPAGVQQDIFERMNRRNRQKKEAQDAQEHERVIKVLAAYHRQVEAMRRGENRPKFDRNSG